MTIRNILFVSVFFFLGVVCSSCSSSANEEQGLSYWASNNLEEIAFTQNAVERWNAAHPGQPVSYQPVPEGQSSEEVILAAVVGKTTPDIYASMWQGDVELYARSGTLIPLDTLDGFLEFLYARCDSNVIREVTSVDGHIYQIPWKINPIMMLYNPAFFEKVGWDSIPATYSEFLAAAEAIKEDTDGDGYVDRWIGSTEVSVIWWQRLFNFYPLYLAASGGRPLVVDDRAAFDNEYAVEVFAFLQKLYANHYFPKEQMKGQSDPFLGEKIAVKFTGPWDIAHAEIFKPEGFRYAFHAMPVPDDLEGPKYTYCDPKSIVIFNTCRQPELAWQFLQQMIDEQGDLKFLKLSGQLPRRKDLLSNPAFVKFFDDHPRLRAFAEQSQYVYGVDSSPVMKEVFDLISQEYEACVVYSKKSPEEAVRDAANAVNLLFMD